MEKEYNVVKVRVDVISYFNYRLRIYFLNLMDLLIFNEILIKYQLGEEKPEFVTNLYLPPRRFDYLKKPRRSFINRDIIINKCFVDKKTKLYNFIFSDYERFCISLIGSDPKYIDKIFKLMKTNKFYYIYGDLNETIKIYDLYYINCEIVFDTKDVIEYEF